MIIVIIVQKEREELLTKYDNLIQGSKSIFRRLYKSKVSMRKVNNI